MSKIIKLTQSSIEPLSNNSFVTKLYNMITYYETYNNSTFDMQHTDFVGILTIPYTYEKYVAKINEYFPRCIITSNDYYILFEDPEVERICVTNWGDGTGITYAQAAAVTNMGSIFQGNNNIVSFNELKYFTNLTNVRFTNCENLVSVNIPLSLKTIGDYMFWGCTNLETIGDITHIEYIYGRGFNGSYKLIFEGNFVNLTGGTLEKCLGFEGEAVFDGTFTSFNCGQNLGAKKIEMKGQWQRGTFNGVTQCKTFILPETTLEVPSKAFDYCFAIKSVIIKATTPPICGDNLFAHTNDADIYVPDESVDAYKVADGWSTYANRIYPISSYQES